MPALRFVPEPRGTTGTPRSFATRSTPATSPVVPGNTTTSGRPRSSGVASVAYVRSVPASSRTWAAPTTRSSAARRSVAVWVVVAMLARGVLSRPRAGHKRTGAYATGAPSATLPTMKQLAYIAQGNSDYDERLRELLDGSGIDPNEFIGLDWFSLVPFYVLAGATVTPDGHAHGPTMHVTGVRVTVPEEFEDGFFETLAEILSDAYADEE